MDKKITDNVEHIQKQGSSAVYSQVNYFKMSNIKNITDKADKAKDLQSLIEVWNEVANNKYSYSLGQIRVANKHIRELALTVEGSDLEKGKFYHALNEMVLFEVGS